MSPKHILKESRIVKIQINIYEIIFLLFITFGFLIISAVGSSLGA